MSSLVRNIGIDYEYSRVKFLDRGSDNVYLGMDLITAPGQLVAVKVIDKCDPYDLYRPSELVELQEDFINEVTTASTLIHPHIIEMKAIYFKDTMNLQNLIVREYQQDGTLSQYMFAESERQWHDWVPLGLPQAVARDITYQIFQALAYMHGRGIAHRNLHPDNILMASIDPPMVKISGLGWAERYEPRNLAASGLSDQAPGWDEYLAPEIVVPAPPHYASDTQADSWSAGILVFRLLLLKTAWCTLRHDGCTTSSRLRWDDLDSLTFPPTRPMTPFEGFDSLASDVPVQHEAAIEPLQDLIVEGTTPIDDTLSFSPEGPGVITNNLPEPPLDEQPEDDLSEDVRLSPNGADLLRQLLRDAPSARLSITDALEHSWLKAPREGHPVVSQERQARL